MDLEARGRTQNSETKVRLTNMVKGAGPKESSVWLYMSTMLVAPGMGPE